MATTYSTRVSPGLYRDNRGNLVRGNQSPTRSVIPTATRTSTPPARTTNTPAQTSQTTTNVTRSKPGFSQEDRQNGLTSRGTTTEQVTTSTSAANQNQQNQQQQQQDRDPNRVRGRIDWLKKRIPVAGTTPAPAGMRPENLPTYNLLTEQERGQFLKLRSQNPRAALRWAQQTTADRSKDASELKTLQDWLTNFEASQNQAPPPPPPPPPPTEGQGQVPPPPPPPGEQPPAQDAANPLTTEFDGNYQSPMTRALMEAFNNVNNTLSAYEPKFFEGSPMYQFQKQKGTADLEKLMAARGLTGSGAEIQGNSDFLANINATEAEKQRQYAEAERDRRQRGMEFIANYDRGERDALRDQWNRNLDRQQNISEFEASRGDRRQEAAINFLNNVLGMQSQSDIARIAQGGQASQTELTKALMQMIGNNIMSQVPRASGGGGGGAPPPPQSNMSGLYEIMMKYGNQAGNNDVFNSILRLFG